MVRSVAQRRVSNHGHDRRSLRPSFETPCFAWLLRMRTCVCGVCREPYFEIRRFARFCAIEENTALSWLACCTS